MLRFIISICIAISLYVLPWWLTFIFACAGVLYFNLYIEGVILVLVLDWLYAPYFNFFPNLHVAPLFALFLCVIAPVIKKRLLVSSF